MPDNKGIKSLWGYSLIDSKGRHAIDDVRSNLENNFQKKNDDTLTTTSKTITGAINEVNAQYKDIAKKTIIEDNKLYLAKEDGSKIDGGTELLFSTKQLDWYNVKEYGAVGDGVTDDSKAFNDLILSVYNDGGGVIYIPKGTYALISDSIYLLSNISFIGDGISKSILKPIYNGGTFNKRFSAIDMNTKDISPYNLYGGDGEEGHKKLFENCIFKDFEIDGSGVVSTDNKYGVGLKGIFAYYMKNCLFENLYIHDTIATGLGVDCLDKTFIRNIVVNNCGYGYGTYTGGTLGGAGIGIGTGYLANENFIITDCIATNCGSNGIFVEHQKLFAQDSNDGYDAEGSVITNCICRNNRNNGIGIRGGKKIRVTNNTVYNNEYGINLNTINAYSVLINNNIIKNNTTVDFHIDKIYFENINFIGNELESISISFLNNSKNILIADNSIKYLKFGNSGDNCSLYNFYIKNNIFIGSSEIALMLDQVNKSNKVINLDISNNYFDQYGSSQTQNKGIIQIISSLENCVISNNTFRMSNNSTVSQAQIVLGVKPIVVGGVNNITVKNNTVSDGVFWGDYRNISYYTNVHYLQGTDVVGKLSQNGRSNDLSTCSLAIVPYTKVRNNLLDFTGKTRFCIHFPAMSKNKYILYHYNISNKGWSLKYDNNTNIILTSDATGTAYSISWSASTLAYIAYRLAFFGTEITLEGTNDNMSWTKIEANSGATMTADNIMTSLSLGECDDILFGYHKNGSIEYAGANSLHNQSINQPLEIYTTSGTNMNETNYKSDGFCRAKYYWNNYGKNTDLIDLASGFNAKVLSNSCYLIQKEQ